MPGCSPVWGGTASVWRLSTVWAKISYLMLEVGDLWNGAFRHCYGYHPDTLPCSHISVIHLIFRQLQMKTTAASSSKLQWLKLKIGPRGSSLSNGRVVCPSYIALKEIQLIHSWYNAATVWVVHQQRKLHPGLVITRSTTTWPCHNETRLILYAKMRCNKYNTDQTLI